MRLVYDEHALRQLCQQILQRCGAVPAEVVLLADDSALTRFANNAIHQNVAERNLTVYLRFCPACAAGRPPPTGWTPPLWTSWRSRR